MFHHATICRNRSARRCRFAACAVVLLLCTGAAGNARPGLLKDQTLAVDGSERSYDLYIPATGTAGSYPVVLLLHGHLGNADVMTGENRKAAPYKVWLEIAERERLLLIIPDGERGADGYRGWNDCRADATILPHTDDVAFIDRLIETVAAKYPIDRTRVYATGTSNGGDMVYRLALERAAVFAAVAPVVGAMAARSQCGMPVEPVPILIMNGSADPFQPWQGGVVGRGNKADAIRGTVISVADSVAFWVNHNAITAAPISRDLPDIDTHDDSTVRVTRYTGGRDGSEVVLYAVRGGGHTEPSLSEHYSFLYRLIVGPQNGDIEMAEEVWRFFSRHHRVSTP